MTHRISGILRTERKYGKIAVMHTRSRVSAVGEIGMVAITAYPGWSDEEFEAVLTEYGLWDSPVGDWNYSIDPYGNETWVIICDYNYRS